MGSGDSGIYPPRSRPRAHRLFADGVCVQYSFVSNRRLCVQSARWHHSPSVAFSSLSSKALFGVESDKFGMLLVCEQEASSALSLSPRVNVQVESAAKSHRYSVKVGK